MQNPSRSKKGTEEAAKRIRFEERLQSVLKTVEKRDSFYKRRFKRLAKKVAVMNSGKKCRGPAKKIFWAIHATTSNSHEEAIKRRISRNPFLSWSIRLCGN